MQSEQHVSREMKSTYSGLQQELASVKEKLHYKDEEMIRLSHSNTELNKQILQLSQEVDQLRHYNANEGTTMVLQHKLQSAKQEIRRLRDAAKRGLTDTTQDNGSEIDVGAEIAVANDAIPSKCGEHHDHHQHHSHSHGKHGHEHDHDHDHHQHHHHHDDTSTPQPDSTVSSNASTIANSDDHYDTNSVSSTINLATNEAMQKLQARFRRTMNEIADLTEEKQRLEHLVLQLQSETETIGEYIALYQTQRRLLKRREVEKDIQLHRIASDREEMRDKLKQLNGLVELLLAQNGVTNATEIMAKINGMNRSKSTDDNATDTQHPNGGNADDADGATATINTNDNAIAGTATTLGSEPTVLGGVNTSSATGTKQDTAKKIINLLADIRDKNLNDNFTSVPNDIHHCPCCSGKLEVV